MATVKHGTYTRPTEWWVHLRPYNKRKIAKAERLAAKRDIAARQKDSV
jgi:hypothetical protein